MNPQDVSSLRDALSRANRKLDRLTEREPSRRSAGLTARLATCAVLSRVTRQPLDAVAKATYPRDPDLAQLITLKAAVSPAVTTNPAWAGELVAITVADIAQNLLPQTVLTQLRTLGIAYQFVQGGLVRVPFHSPTPSGAFVLESGAIPAGALILSSFSMKPKKAASITAFSKELAHGSPVNVEQSLRVLLGEDLGLMVDGILLGSAAATTSAPAGLFAGVTPITATTGGGLAALIDDVKALLAAIAPAIRPVLITGTVQAATIGMLAPASVLPVIVAPYMAADAIAAVDAAAFASALGVPDFLVSEDPTVHMADAPLPISEAGTPNTVAAPVTSLWQVEAVGVRAILPCDWALRRANAVALITGATW